MLTAFYKTQFLLNTNNVIQAINRLLLLLYIFKF